MKRKFFLFVSVFFLAFSWQGFGQVSIGSGNEIDKSLPVEPYYNYSYSQVIYLASEINASGDITTLTWDFTGSSISSSNEWTIYMGHTSKNEFSGSSGWIDVSTLTQVFSGTVTLDANNKVVVDITDFTYNGTDNLVIAVDENGSGYDSDSDDFYCSGVSSNRGLEYHSDLTNPDPANPPDGNLKAYIANITLGGITPTCPVPTGQTESNITASSADLDWTENGSATQWEIEYGHQGFALGNGTIVSVSAHPYTLSGLSSNTTYDWYVRANCGGGDNSSWMGPHSFTTLCNIYTPDYLQEFETFLPFCWDEGKGPESGPVSTGSSDWEQDDFGNNPANTGSARIHLTDQHKDWLLSTHFDLSGGGYQLECDVAVTKFLNSQPATMGADDAVKLLISTDGGASWSALMTWDANNTPSNTGDHVIIDLSAYTQTDVQFAYWATDGSNYDSSLNFYVDNFQVRTPPACAEPSILLVDTLTSSTADVSWIDNTNGSASYLVEWRETGTSTWSSGTTAQGATSYQITNLSPSTQYEWQLTADCGGGNNSSTKSGPDFITKPVNDDCSNATVLICGDTLTGETTDGATDNGDDTGCDMGKGVWYKITPSSDMELKVTADPVSINIEISVSSSSDCNTFTNIACVNNTGWGGKETYTFIADAGTTYYFYVGYYSWANITGDFDISLLCNSCFSPSDQTESNITGTSVDLDWTENGSATEWEIEYGPHGFAHGSGTIVTATNKPYHLSGLSSNTTYDWYVRAKCSNTDYSFWTGRSSFTTLYTPDYLEEFETFLPDSWEEGRGPETGPDSTGSSYWSQGDFGNDPVNSKSARVLFSSNVHKEWLISPHFDLSGGGYQLECDVAVTQLYNSGASNMGSDDKVKLLISTDGGNSWSTLMTWDANNTPSNTGDHAIVDLSSYTQTDVQFAYWATDGSVDDGILYYFYVDNFQIRTPPPCMEPSNQKESNITASTADLDWTENGSATEWEIEYGTHGFTQGSGTIITTTTKPYHLTGLSDDTSYDWYIRAKCGSTVYSVWTGPHTFSTPCLLTPDYMQDFETYLPDCWQEGIGPESGPVITNSNWTQDNFANNYSYSKSARINLYNNAHKDWLLSPHFDLSGGGYQVECDVAVTTYSGTGASNMGSDDEVKLLISADGGITWSALMTWDANNTPSNTGDHITIDISTYTQQDVQFAYWASDGSVDDPENYNFYVDNFQVKTPPSCADPANLIVDTVTTNTADVSWTDNTGGTASYLVEWKEVGASSWNSGTTSQGATSYHITNLTSSTHYEWQLTADCGGGDNSITKSGPNFTTKPVNDDCSNAKILNCGDTLTGETTTGATANGDNTGCSMGKGVWYKTTPSTDLELTVTVDPGSGFNVKISISSSSDCNTFSNIACVDNGNSGEEETYTFIANAGTTYYFYVGYWSNNSNMTGDFDISLVCHTCFTPSYQNEDNITATSADLSWTENGSATEWEIEYGTHGFTQGSGTTVTATTNPYNLSGLSSNTTYDWYVRAKCSSTDYSGWTGPSTFSTPCLLTPDYLQEFETFLPTCWEEGQGPETGPSSKGSSDWAQGNFANVNNNSMSARINLYSVGNKEWLLSPHFDLSAGGYQLECDVAVTEYYGTDASSMGSDDKVKLLISTDGGITWSALMTWDANNTPSNTGDHITIDISAYTQPDVQFAYWATDGSVNDPEDYNFYVDNFKIRTIPSCIEPTYQTETNITTSTADLDWTENGSATEWEIEYGVSGFSQGDGNILSVSTHPYTLSNLTSGTTYDWYVRANCGNGDYSTWTGPHTFTTLCEANTSYPFTEEFESSSFPPNCWLEERDPASSSYGWSSHSNGYSGKCARFDSYYNSNGNKSKLITQPLDLTSLSAAQLRFYFKNPSGGDFSILISTDGGTNYSTLASGLTGQNDWIEKTYDISSYIGSNVVIAFQGTSNYGSGDAYIYLDNVIVDAPVSCLAPSNQAESNITSTSADLSWTETGGATSWQISYGESPFTAGDDSGTTSVVGNPPVTITGLDANKDYDWYVRSICSPGDTSAWVGPHTFTTLCNKVNVPYSNNFENDDDCWTVLDANGDGKTWVRSSGVCGSYGFKATYDSNNAMDDWVFSPDFILTGGTTYQIKFSSGNENTAKTEKLEVFLMNGSDPGTATKILIYRDENIDDGQCYPSIIEVTAPSGWNDYYVGFHGYSIANQSAIYLDDFSIKEAPAASSLTVSETNANTCDTWIINGVAGDIWHHFYDSNGNIVGSIKANNQNLGTSFVKMRDGTVEEWTDSGDGSMKKTMPRYFDFDSENSFNSNVTVRLYYSNDDLTDFNNSTLGGGTSNYSPADLDVTHYDGSNEDCNFANNDFANGVFTKIDNADITNADISNGFYLEFDVSSFSELMSHEPSVGAMPLDLLSFTGFAGKKANIIKWTTANEFDIDHFTVQSSLDRKIWSTVAEVIPAGKNSSYKVVDNNPYFKTYYRLKIVSANGKIDFSNIIFVQRKVAGLQFNALYPNPNDGNFMVNVTTVPGKQSNVYLVNMLGEKVFSTVINEEGGTSIIKIKVSHIPGGIYSLLLEQGNQRIIKKVIINK